jgi:hypothetical protein
MTFDFVPPQYCLGWKRFFFHRAKRTLPSCAFWTLRILGITVGCVRFHHAG